MIYGVGKPFITKHSNRCATWGTAVEHPSSPWSIRPKNLSTCRSYVTLCCMAISSMTGEQNASCSTLKPLNSMHNHEVMPISLVEWPTYFWRSCMLIAFVGACLANYTFPQIDVTVVGLLRGETADLVSNELGSLVTLPSTIQYLHKTGNVLVIFITRTSLVLCPCGEGCSSTSTMLNCCLFLVQVHY